jgi:oligopeptide transport system substrate-binding protein
LAVLAAALLAACQPAASGPVPSSSPNGQVHRDLRVRLAYAPRTLDPALATSEVETGIIRQVWEPLLKPSPGLGGLEPAAAEAWQVSPDGLTYTFRLRAGGRYSDGEPVRAQDFVYAWRRIIDPRIASPVADLFAVVVKGGEQAEALDPIIDVPRLEPALAGLGLAAPDERTFVLTLPRPAAQTPWIASLVQGVPLRRDLVEKSKDWWNQPAGLVGNGAFRAAAIEPATHVDLLAEGRYWAGRPALDGISFQVLSDEAEVLSRYDAGRLDIAELNAADPGRRANHLSQLELTAHWLHVNTQRPPFDDARVREALALAVDREALLSGPLQPRAASLGDLIPAGMTGHLPDAAAEQRFNAGRARSLLQSAGVDPGRISPVVLLAGADESERNLAGALARQVEQNLGVRVQVEAVDAPTAYQRRITGEFQLTGPVGWTADYPDPQDWFDLFRSSDIHNLSRWRNPLYDALVAQADVDSDPGRRSQLYRQAHLLLLEQVPAVFLYQRQRLSLVRPGVRGLVQSPLDEWAGSLNAARIRGA